ncbi:hypothetical protein [Emcibacter sp.]|uniref:hypothetical protein n=1 Tax=Emcibacter sp. TaxID=1979954 RepID=UPI003A8F291E
MSSENEKPESAPDTDPTDIDKLAEKYLDFWQQNLTIWATDPKALERWVETLSAGQSDKPEKTD